MKRKRLLRRIAIFGLLVLVLAAAGLWASLSLPYQGFASESFVKFEHGSGTGAMAQTLAQSGAVRYAWEFWLERALNPGTKLLAGEYRFNQPASVREVFGRIARGDVYFVELSIPEGSNMFDIARIAESAGIMPAQDFLAAADNPAAIHELDPKAPSLEGYLFPATYRVSHSTTAAELCGMMTGQFKRQWRKLTSDAHVDSHMDPHSAVTLASLVEKETSLEMERPLVSSVFSNRLKIGMKLDCDPTTIYAALLDNRYRGAIHRSDLNSHNPYNTYQNQGLPPGPITNPGVAALTAALHPAQTEYLYFVAKPAGGGHEFSATLAAHDKAVRNYRNGLHENGKQQHEQQPAKSAPKAPKKA